MTIAANLSDAHAGIMHAEELYTVLMEARAPEFDEFDAHVVASILAISFGEAVAEGRALTSATGLPSGQLNELVAQIFPSAAPWRFFAPGAGVERKADESCLLDLLTSCATSGTVFETRLAAMIARRAQCPNHLWQDLGLRDRRDLSELMMRHFKPLAMRNRQDMKWKKFFYRAICAEASYSLCTAPSCGECDDFDHCFGEETGESLLARARR
jgi:nitrogen fixation protein NifQ